MRKLFFLVLLSVFLAIPSYVMADAWTITGSGTGYDFFIGWDDDGGTGGAVERLTQAEAFAILGLQTTVGNPGADTNIVSEQGIREEFTSHTGAADPHTGYMLESNIGIGDGNYPMMDDAGCNAGELLLITATGIECVATLSVSSIQDSVPIVGSTDATKKITFDVEDNITTENTRDYDVPNWSGMIASDSGPVLDDPDNVTMSGANLHGGVYIANAAGTYTLGAVGTDQYIDFCIMVRGAVAVTLAVNAADTAYLDGVAETQGEDIAGDGTAGGILCCVYGGAANTLECSGDGTFDGATD